MKTTTATTQRPLFYVFSTQFTSSYYRRMRESEKALTDCLYYTYMRRQSRPLPSSSLTSCIPPSSSYVAAYTYQASTYPSHLAFKTCSLFAIFSKPSTRSAGPALTSLFISFATQAIHLWVNPIIHVSQNVRAPLCICLCRAKLSNAELKFSVLLL